MKDTGTSVPVPSLYSIHLISGLPGSVTKTTVTKLATSPDEAMTMVERDGYDYQEAEVELNGEQIAVYGPRQMSDEEFEQHRAADPHCTCNDCLAYHEAHLDNSTE
jgi:hypothetical protein